MELVLLPQGQAERQSRAENTVAQLDKEGFGSCFNIGLCAAECPAGITLGNIATLNRKYLVAKVTSNNLAQGHGNQHQKSLRKTDSGGRHPHSGGPAMAARPDQRKSR